MTAFLEHLPHRGPKPRTEGITAVMDSGLSVGELRSVLADHAELVDVAKFGIGSAYVTPRLGEKIELYREHGVIPYFGGTLFEKFYYQNKVSAFLDYLHQHGIDWIEISSGTIDIPLSGRLDIVAQVVDRGFTPLAEVGCKDAAKVMPPSEWIDEISAFLEAGCNYVITEGRDSGTAGVFRPSGEIRTGLVSDIVSSVDASKLLFEAPSGQAQMYFINLIGPNVNLGNVPPSDLVRLEAQRHGLRSETFYLDPT